jgi:hypothetical protein
LDIILVWFKNNVPKRVKNKFLLVAGSYRNTACHCTANWGKLNVLQKVWNLAKDNVTTGGMKISFCYPQTVTGIQPGAGQ